MELNGQSLARTPAPPFPSMHRRALRLRVAGIAGLALTLLLLADDGLGGPVVRILAAGVGVFFAHRGWAAGSGRERQVRGWILGAAAVWFAAECARLVGAVIGQSSLMAELGLIGLAVGAIGAYVSTARGRMRPADEIGLYLDAIGIFAATTGAVIVVGARQVDDPTALPILAHAAFFLAIMAATFLLNVTTRAPLRFEGQWEMLAGLGLGGIAYIGLLLPIPLGVAREVLHVTVGIAAMMVGHGGGRWTAMSEDGGAYLRIAAWLRYLLPLASVAVAVTVVMTRITTPLIADGPLRVAAAVALATVILCAIARQTVLLVDRERMIGRERQLTDELTVAEAQYRSVVERVPGVVYLAEAGQEGRWHFVSNKIEELLGYTPDEWVSDPTLWLNRIHPADRDRMVLAEEDTERVVAKGRWEYRLIARDGSVVWVLDDEAVVARDADGRPAMVQGILVDITERKDLEDQLRHQALHDPLTGLPNRVLFVDRLSHALLRRQRVDGLAVLFLDLDEFKSINDSLGHAAGDELLRFVADRLARALRAEDTACRLGGDEFAFLLEDVDPRRAEAIARRILEALADPFHLGERDVTLTASIGVATLRLPGEADATHSADDLLRDADTAMYVAKARGRDRIEIFERGMEVPSARRRELRSGLARALDLDGELFLEYQPIVDMQRFSIVGLEALARWQHPQLGRLMPAQFIPMAEEAGLITRLGEWVLRRACADMAAAGVPVSVNVSAHQLGDGSLPRLVAEVLAESGLPPSRLLLELTESTLASAGAGAETELTSVQQLGVRIALDDFGSGYSSLEYLGRLPIDVLKIDRSLIERVHEEPQRHEVMRAIGHIAEKLGLETIVEGVEHDGQRQALLALGFRHAQGFFFSGAVPRADALAPMEHRRAS
ncbi:MAG: putative bifunctional diguanylate cyclase/phosphodiesterase [Chloroflexota bacterium]